MFKLSFFLVSKLNQVDLFIWCTNRANEYWAKFCVEEVFKCKERRMIWEDEGWTKSQSSGCPCHPPRNIQEVQASKLGDAQGIPFFINNIIRSPFKTLYFIASYTMCYSWSAFLFCFQFCFVFLLVINGWILAILIGEKHTPLYCLLHYSFHSYTFWVSSFCY